MFKGLSTLRKQERKAAVDTEETIKLQAYLSKYTAASGRRLDLSLHSGGGTPGPTLCWCTEEELSFQSIYWSRKCLTPVLCTVWQSCGLPPRRKGVGAAQEGTAMRRRGKRRKRWRQPQRCASWMRMPRASDQALLYACRAMMRMLRMQMKVSANAARTSHWCRQNPPGGSGILLCEHGEVIRDHGLLNAPRSAALANFGKK